MGGELGDEHEWAHDSSLDWRLLDDPAHAGVQHLITDLGALYAGVPSLWELDESPNGFQWIDPGNADQNVLSFIRRDANGHPGIACVANFSPVVRYDFRVGLPLPGRWTEVLNTDSEHYGGSGVGNMGAVGGRSGAVERLLGLGLADPAAAGDPLARALPHCLTSAKP